MAQFIYTNPADGPSNRQPLTDHPVIRGGRLISSRFAYNIVSVILWVTILSASIVAWCGLLHIGAKLAGWA